MRERHWAEVMHITGHQLALAEDVFKLQHLLDCNLLKFREDIEDLTGRVRFGTICMSAGHMHVLVISSRCGPAWS
jgi:hypothetical protein